MNTFIPILLGFTLAFLSAAISEAQSLPKIDSLKIVPENKIRTVMTNKKSIGVYISGLPEGIYFILTANGEKRWTKKMIKNAP